MTSKMKFRPLMMTLSMAAVFLLATALYLVNLNAVSFWEDESWMAIAIGDGLPDVWTFATERGVHPPLYFYMAWFWSRLAGNSELALRWMGGLVTLIGLAFTYRNGRELYNHRAGFFAALLAAGMIYLIYLTRLARHYTLYFALTALLLWVYQRWSRSRDDRYLAGITLSMVGLLYTHYFGIWMVLIVGLHSLITHHFLRTIKLGVAFIGSAILFIPWLPSLDYQLRFSGQGAGIQYAIRDVEAIIRNYQDRITNTFPELALLMLVFAVIALIQAKKWRWLLLLLIHSFIVAGLIIALNDRFAWYIGRNMMYAVSGVVLLYGIGLAWLTHWRIGTLLAGVICIAFIGSGLRAYDEFWLETTDWRHAVGRIAAEAGPDDIFVVDGEKYSIDYYMRRFMGERLTFYDMKTWEQNPIGEDRIWLIDSGMAVNFEAIDALPPDVVQVRRLVNLPIVSELYRRPPQEIRVTFDEQIALGSDEPVSITLRPGENFTLDLWWQALRSPAASYKAGVYLIGETGLIAQHDDLFNDGRLLSQELPVEQWLPDTIMLPLPDNTIPGTYAVAVAIYNPDTGTRMSVPETTDNLYELLTVVVE